MLQNLHGKVALKAPFYLGTMPEMTGTVSAKWLALFRGSSSISVIDAIHLSLKPDILPFNQSCT
jgi:hypothetical protein